MKNKLMQKQQGCVAVWWKVGGVTATEENNTTMIDELCGS